MNIQLPSRILFTILLSLQIFSCAGPDINDADPAELVKLAEKDIENDRYQLAIDKLRLAKNKFPYSHMATEAQLRLADVYFLQESFGEAAIAYESFKDLHPKHARISYAMFRIAKSYFNDIPSNLARDLTSANKAQDAYNEYLSKFPTSPEAGEAKKDLAETRRILSEKEYYIGHFYEHREFWLSSKNRYEKINAVYPETEAAKKAAEHLPHVTAELEAQNKKQEASH